LSVELRTGGEQQITERLRWAQAIAWARLVMLGTDLVRVYRRKLGSRITGLSRPQSARSICEALPEVVARTRLEGLGDGGIIRECSVGQPEK
jgi:hypothetical protein